MNSRRAFLAGVSVAAGSVALAGAAAPAGATPEFDRAAFEARIRRPIAHRQAFATASVADGAVFGFITNSLDAYERGFGEGPGTLHPAAVFYHTAVVMALDDAAWRTYGIGEIIRRGFDRTSAQPPDGNPYVHGPHGRTIADVQRRGASLFVCRNALDDMARKLSVSSGDLDAHLLPGMMVVPAGVAALNALQEEHFSLFVAAL